MMNLRADVSSLPVLICNISLLRSTGISNDLPYARRENFNASVARAMLRLRLAETTSIDFSKPNFDRLHS